MRKQEIGLRAEYKVAALLADGYHRNVSRCQYRSPYDLVVDGYRTEVKCAAPQKYKAGLIWNFNIHRHGVLSEQTDIYICRLEEIPYSKYAIHMLFKAPLEVKVIWVSMRSLLNQDWAAAVADFYAFAKGTYGKREVAA